MRTARETGLFGVFLLVACGSKSPPDVASVPQPQAAPSASVVVAAIAPPAGTAPIVDPAPSAAPTPKEEGISRGPLKTPEDAIRAFRAAWSGDVTSALRARQSLAPLRRSADVQVGKVSASLQPCRTLATELRRVWAVQRSQVIYGSADGLDRAGQCWAVVTAHAMFPVAGYLTAADGRLVLAWQIPEA